MISLANKHSTLITYRYRLISFIIMKPIENLMLLIMIKNVIDSKSYLKMN